jgi:hypothetical protein
MAKSHHQSIPSESSTSQGSLPAAGNYIFLYKNSKISTSPRLLAPGSPKGFTGQRSCPQPVDFLWKFPRNYIFLYVNFGNSQGFVAYGLPLYGLEGSPGEMMEMLTPFGGQRWAKPNKSKGHR